MIVVEELGEVPQPVLHAGREHCFERGHRLGAEVGDPVEDEPGPPGADEVPGDPWQAGEHEVAAERTLEVGHLDHGHGRACVPEEDPCLRDAGEQRMRLRAAGHRCAGRGRGRAEERGDDHDSSCPPPHALDYTGARGRVERIEKSP